MPTPSEAQQYGNVATDLCVVNAFFECNMLVCWPWSMMAVAACLTSRQRHWRRRRPGTWPTPGKAQQHHETGAWRCVFVLGRASTCGRVEPEQACLMSANNIGDEGAKSLGPHLAKLTSISLLGLACARW